MTIIARLKHTWTVVALHAMHECGDILQVWSYVFQVDLDAFNVQEPLVDRLEMRCTGLANNTRCLSWQSILRLLIHVH